MTDEDDINDRAGLRMTADQLSRENAELRRALHESEARRRLIENRAQATWETDAAGIVVADSPSWRAYTGQTPEEWLGYGWLDAIHPDDRAYAERRWRDAVAACGLVDAEFRLRSPDGGWRWTNVVAALVPDADGRVAKWTGINIDITARKQAELTARQNEERQAFLLKLSDALRTLDDPLDIQRTASRVLRERLGAIRVAYAQMMPDGHSCTLMAEDVANPSLSLAGMVADWNDFDPVAHAASQRGETFVREDLSAADDLTPQRKATFAALGVHAFVTTPLVKAGRLVAFFVAQFGAPRRLGPDEIALAEETAERTWAAVERARSEAARRESEARYRMLFDAMDEGFYYAKAIFDEDGRCVDIFYHEENPAAIRMIGQSAKGRLMSELGDYEPYWRDVFGHTARTGEPQRLERFASVDEIWFDFYVFKPEIAVDNMFAVVFSDATERRRAQDALRRSEERFRALVTASSFAVYRMSPDWRLMYELGGGPLAATTAPSEDWDEKYILAEDRPRVHAAIAEAIRTKTLFELEHRVRLADGGIGWVASRAVPLIGADGEIVEWFGAGSDVTERRMLQDRQEVLVAELQHRTRNLITVIRALAQQTLGEAMTFDDVRSELNRRLAALSRVQGLLSHLSAGARVTFGELLRSELMALGAPAERTTLDGPDDVKLRSATVQTFALALHELATNALKYGAFATAAGTLTVRWTVGTRPDSAVRLHVDWRERGVDVAGAAPSDGGYGRELIEQALPYQLGAATTYELTPDGVHCTIDVPTAAPAG